MANDDMDYKRWIEGQPCCVCDMRGSVVMHHRTGAGMGLRSSDHEGIPLCSDHHGAFHALNGVFKSWKRDDLQRWQSAMIRLHRAHYVMVMQALGKQVEGDVAY